MSVLLSGQWLSRVQRELLTIAYMIYGSNCTCGVQRYNWPNSRCKNCKKRTCFKLFIVGWSFKLQLQYLQCLLEWMWCSEQSYFDGLSTNNLNLNDSVALVWIRNVQNWLRNSNNSETRHEPGKLYWRHSWSALIHVYLMILNGWV